MSSSVSHVPTCFIEGCAKPRSGRSRYCSTHRARIARHGSPDVVKKPSYRSGSEHHAWTEEPTYRAVHQRIRKVRGKASDHDCECGAPAKQWAYVGNRDFNQRRPYSTDLQNDYKPMCIPCHKAADVSMMQVAQPSRRGAEWLSLGVEMRQAGATYREIGVAVGRSHTAVMRLLRKYPNGVDGDAREAVDLRP